MKFVKFREADKLLYYNRKFQHDEFLLEIFQKARPLETKWHFFFFLLNL